MKILSPLLFLLILSTELKSQDYLGSYRDIIIVNLENMSQGNYKVSIKEKIIQIDTLYYKRIANEYEIDTITVINAVIEGKEKIEADYYFNTYDNLCDSIVLRYYCCDCMNSTISELLSSGARKWKKISEDKYISRKNTKKAVYKNYDEEKSSDDKTGSMHLEVDRKTEGELCGIITLYSILMNKDEWKKLTK